MAIPRYSTERVAFLQAVLDLLRNEVDPNSNVGQFYFKTFCRTARSNLYSGRTTAPHLGSNWSEHVPARLQELELVKRVDGLKHGIGTYWVNPNGTVADAVKELHMGPKPRVEQVSFDIELVDKLQEVLATQQLDVRDMRQLRFHLGKAVDILDEALARHTPTGT